MRGLRFVAGFIVLDGLVLGLSMCRPVSAPDAPDVPRDAATSTSVVSVAEAPFALAPAPATGAPGSSVSVSASVGVSAPLTPPSALMSSFVNPPESCAELDRALATAFETRGCRTDVECTNRSVYCGCAQPVSAVMAPRIDALQKKWTARRCMDRAPLPCATCPPPRTPRCVGGACTPGAAP